VKGTGGAKLGRGAPFVGHKKGREKGTGESGGMTGTFEGMGGVWSYTVAERVIEKQTTRSEGVEKKRIVGGGK